MPKALSPVTAMSEADTDLFWREASGPNGDRARDALPLYRAIFAHDHRDVATLLDHGASPNTVLYAERWSPLMVAVGCQDKEMASLLLRHGANINYVSADPATYTPLGVAINAAISDALRRGGDHPVVDFAMFNFLLDAGADVNVEFGYHEDIAIFAATTGQMSIVNELLARGYHRDLEGLKKTLQIRLVSEDAQADKDRAIASIDQMLRHK